MSVCGSSVRQSKVNVTLFLVSRHGIAFLMCHILRCELRLLVYYLAGSRSEPWMKLVTNVPGRAVCELPVAVGLRTSL